MKPAGIFPAGRFVLFCFVFLKCCFIDVSLFCEVVLEVDLEVHLEVDSDVDLDVNLEVPEHLPSEGRKTAFC